MEFNLFSTAAALIAAAALTWLVLRFFFGAQKAASGAMDASGKRQTATITVKGGYSPAVVSMRAGTPITLTFDRQETGECTSHVVFGDLGLDAMLPGNAVTDVELPALPAGEYPFACGMNMVHGLLRSKEMPAQARTNCTRSLHQRKPRWWTPQKQNDVRQRNARRKSHR